MKNASASEEAQIDTQIGDGQYGAGKSIAKARTAEIIEAEVDFDEMPDVSVLQSMSRGKSLVAKYRTQEDWYELKDKPIRAVFKGLKEIPNDKGEVVACAVFVDETGVFLSAQKTLLDGVKRLVSNRAVEIIYRGKKKNKNSDGSTNIFEVYELQ